MRKKVMFENGIREVQIVHDGGFKCLHLISTVIDNVEDPKVIPSVELILTNDKAMFTSYGNLVTGTKNLYCFDLLLTAANNPALSNETFHTLKCVAHDNSDAVIEMEFEIE